jgi:hypothetical protein
VKVVRLAAAAALAIIVVELCAREVARRSLFELAGGMTVGLGALAVAAIAAGAAGIVASRHWPRVRVAVLFVTLFAIGVAVQIQSGARLQSDGFYYFSYLRSIAFDHDVEFSNDYRLLGLGDKPHLFEPTPTGYAQSAWTIGPAFVWAPFFAAAHPIAVRLHASGADVSTYGISYPYRQAVCIAGLFFGLLGCWFMFRCARLFFDTTLAAGAVAFTVGGSFMLWYMVREPSMTHAPAMAGVAALAWMWAATHGRRTMTQWALMGLLAGFITMIRWQNALFAILPAYEALTLLVSAWRRNDRAGVQSTLAAGAIFTACAVAGFIPQMLAWKSIYGSYLAVSPVGPQIRWWDPHLVDILWSSRNGLLSWSPVLYVGAIGLFLFAVARPAVGVPSVIAIAVMIYFNASIQDWWGSAGYGGRRFDGTIPLFVLGVAAFAERAAAVVRRHPMEVVTAGAGLLLVWNLTLMRAAHEGHVRIGESMSFGEAGAHQARAFHRWFGHPFTYPVSLFYAARNGVGLGDYDLLSANRFLSDPLRPYGRIDIGEAADEPWIGDGWHAPEQANGISYRWADAEANAIVPLDRAANLRVQVRALAFNYPGAPPQRMTLIVNGHEQSAEVVPNEWDTVVFEVPSDAWRTGVNQVRLAFNRAAQPAEVGVGGDTRRLAGAVDYLRIEVMDGAPSR